MTKPRKAASLEEMVKLCARRRAAGKRAYTRADTLFEEILQQMKPGQIVGGYKLVDNYESKTKVFRAHGIARYELEKVEV